MVTLGHGTEIAEQVMNIQVIAPVIISVHSAYLSSLMIFRRFKIGVSFHREVSYFCWLHAAEEWTVEYQ